MASVDKGALRDRYRGALLASAAGDALGATVEFMSRDDVAAEFGVLRDIVGGGWLRLPAGEVTDDTQMARCIARSIAERGLVDPADIASRFVEWYRSGPPDIGNTTRRALELLDAGLAWDEAGARTHVELRPRDASNGSLMRTAPVALYARVDTTLNRRCSADVSRITHANPQCIDACIALDSAVAALLADPDVPALEVARAAAAQPETRASLDAVRGETAATLNAGGHVLATLGSAFWALSAHDTLEEAIVAAVNLGDDADTTGAVAGALTGARWGMADIPPRWLDALIGRQELIELADRLFELSLSRVGRLGG